MRCACTIGKNLFVTLALLVSVRESYKTWRCHRGRAQLTCFVVSLLKATLFSCISHVYSAELPRKKGLHVARCFSSQTCGKPLRLCIGSISGSCYQKCAFQYEGVRRMFRRVARIHTTVGNAFWAVNQHQIAKNMIVHSHYYLVVTIDVHANNVWGGCLYPPTIRNLLTALYQNRRASSGCSPLSVLLFRDLNQVLNVIVTKWIGWVDH